jgi:hypothetical protein
MIWGLIPNIVYQFSTESRRKSTAIARGQIVPDPVYQKLVEKVDFVLLKYLTGLVREIIFHSETSKRIRNMVEDLLIKKNN